MKLSGLTIRQIAIDAAPRDGTEGIPAGRPATWHYPLVTLHTDEGIDGYTMGYGNQGDGRAIACLMRDVFWPKIRGENPLEIERLWPRLRRANRDLYALSDLTGGSSRSAPAVSTDRLLLKSTGADTAPRRAVLSGLASGHSSEAEITKPLRKREQRLSVAASMPKPAPTRPGHLSVLARQPWRGGFGLCRRPCTLNSFP